MLLVIAARVKASTEKTQSIVFRIFYYSLPAVLLVIPILICNQAHADSIDLETRIQLQLALKKHIDAVTADGVYEHFNIEQGQIEKLKLKNLHPVIFATENKYMMCADFFDANGKDVLLDYIVSFSATGFRIEQEIRGRRSYLTQLFERIY